MVIGLCEWVLSSSESPPELLFIVASGLLPCGELGPEHGTSCDLDGSWTSSTFLGRCQAPRS